MHAASDNDMGSFDLLLKDSSALMQDKTSKKNRQMGKDFSLDISDIEVNKEKNDFPTPYFNRKQPF